MTTDNKCEYTAPMRLVHYNILDGGVGRADPLAEILLAQRADIICLAEADDQAVLHRLAERLQMDYVPAQGSGHAGAIFSRWPITQSINHAMLHPKAGNSLVEATVDTPGGAIVVVAVHLSAGALEADENKRLEQLSIILQLLAPYRAAATPHLLAGDLNANSPVQRIDPARLKPRTRQEWEHNGQKLPRRALQLLLDAGYGDTLAMVDPNAAATAGTFSTQYPGQRVDYIFSYGFAVASHQVAWIETDRLAQFASDHYPVGVQMDISNQAAR